MQKRQKKQKAMTPFKDHNTTATACPDDSLSIRPGSRSPIRLPRVVGLKSALAKTFPGIAPARDYIGDRFYKL
jgi:hypothetical protein